MASLTYKLEKLREKKLAGKRAVVDVGGTSYDFLGVVFGGTSPLVTLGLGDQRIVHTAAEWKRLGAKLP